MGTSQTLLISLLVLLQLVQGSRANSEAVLIKKLLSDYDTSARPVMNQDDAVPVHIDVTLQSIIDIDELQQEVITKVWLRLEWTDENLRWNITEEHGLKALTILPIRIWKPDITLYDDLDHQPNDYLSKLYPAKITNEGKVNWGVPKIISSSCTVDVQYYPWDEQFCPFKFTSWTYDQSKLDLTNTSASVEMKYYSSSSEWSVMSFNAKRNVIVYGKRSFPDVTYTLEVRRKPIYYLFNLILPAVFITFFAVLVFYLPPDSGEKVSLSVTVVLALTVFLLLVAESVPKSDTVPLMGKYFASVIMLMAVSAAFTVINVNNHHKGLFGSKIPTCIKVLVLNWLARAMCMKAMVDANISEESKNGGNDAGNTNGGYKHDAEMMASDRSTENGKQKGADPTLLAILNVLKGFQKSKEEDNLGDACKMDWMLVSAVIDRLLLFFFLLINVLVTIIILSDHPSYSKTPIG